MKRFNPITVIPVGFAPEKAAAVTVAVETAIAHRPIPQIPDPRPNPDVQDLRAKHAAKEARELALFVARYGQPGAPEVETPEGMLSITAGLHFDDSDGMTDYWCPHAGLGPEFLLLHVRKQARTERLARKALALAPELARLTWHWHKGDHRLMSDPVELPEELRGLRNRYRGGEVGMAHWLIELGHWKKRHLPYATVGKTAEVKPTAGNDDVGGMSITATRHTKKGYAIWVVVASVRVDRPTFEALRAECKALGGWYSNYRGGGAIPGFTFTEEAPARQFMANHAQGCVKSSQISQTPEAAAEAADMAARAAILLSGRSAVLPEHNGGASVPASLPCSALPAPHSALPHVPASRPSFPHPVIETEQGDVAAELAAAEACPQTPDPMPHPLPEAEPNIIAVQFTPPAWPVLPPKKANPFLQRFHAHATI